MMRAGIDKKSLIFFILMMSLSVLSFGSGRGSLDPPVQELLKIDSIANKARASFLDYAHFAYDEINEKNMSFRIYW